MKDQINRSVEQKRKAIFETWAQLHAMPEPGHREFKTSAYLKEQLEASDISVEAVADTGLVAQLTGGQPGLTVGLRADIDALPFKNEAGETYYVHACGHDANATMVLWTIRILKELGLINKGTFKAIFQPAEELLSGAKAMIKEGVGADLDEFYGVHLASKQAVPLGQAAPALLHSSSGGIEAVFEGQSAHGSRPDLGINTIDAAALATLGINSIWCNPQKAWSAKVTKISGGGEALNIIPERTVMSVDVRGEDSQIIGDVIAKVNAACEHAARTVGAKASTELLRLVPTTPYNAETMAHLEEAISAVLGAEGLLGPRFSTGGDDFHEFKVAYPELKTAFLSLGSDVDPGLHDPLMTFDQEALIIGTKILALTIAQRLA